MARKAIDNALNGAPDMAADPIIHSQVDYLAAEARLTLQAIRHIGDDLSPDPWTDPATLVKSVKLGILDAPQLRNNPFALGQIVTRVSGGSCVAVNPQGLPLRESERLEKFLH